MPLSESDLVDIRAAHEGLGISREQAERLIAEVQNQQATITVLREEIAMLKVPQTPRAVMKKLGVSKESSS